MEVSIRLPLSVFLVRGDLRGKTARSFILVSLHGLGYGKSFAVFRLVRVSLSQSVGGAEMVKFAEGGRVVKDTTHIDVSM